MSIEIKPDQMISLGYGKFWRSDAILGLTPIEEQRGPGRRTEVHTATLEDPIVASRTEQAILRDMAVAYDEHFQIQEARDILADLLDSLDDVPDVLRRMLAAEANFDVPRWKQRLQALMREESSENPGDQSDLFGQ